MKKVLRFFILTTLLLFSINISNVYAQEDNQVNTQSNSDSLNNFEIDYDSNYEVTCEDMLGAPAVSKVLKSVYNFIRIGGSIVLVVTAMLDYTKAVTSSDSDLMKKATKRFITRTIVLFAIFLVPSLLNLIVSLVFGDGQFCTI